MISTRFSNWRSDTTPLVEANPLAFAIDDSLCLDKDLKLAVKKGLAEKYKASMQAMESAVAVACCQYIESGPLLSFAQMYSRRYYEMYKAVAQMEYEQRKPLIPATPGQLKRQGFTTDDILSLIKPSKKLIDISDEVFNHFYQQTSDRIKPSTRIEQAHAGYEEFMSILTDGKKRSNSVMTSHLHPTLQDAIDRYRSICIDDIELAALEKKIANEFTADTDKNKKVKRFMRLIADPEKREKVLRGGDSAMGSPELSEFLDHKTKSIYHRLKQFIIDYDKVALLDRVYFMFHSFGHESYKSITNLLSTIARLSEDLTGLRVNASVQERLLMEIRHRVCGDMEGSLNSFGSIGGNPLAYVNMIEHGEENAEAEFRERMYFVYASNHFANYIIQRQDIIDYINRYLEFHKCGWIIDQDYIDEALRRSNEKRIQDGKDIAPIFRYGSQADQNWALRAFREKKEIEDYYAKNPNPAIKDAIRIDDSHAESRHLRLSDRELMNQVGEIGGRRCMIHGDRQLNYWTGAAVFKLKSHPDELDMRATASIRAYLQTVIDLHIPVSSGISGTLDQSIAMAGLVGLGIDDDLTKRTESLQVIKLACMAFMLPTKDHTIHEILQSAKSYGLPYIAGPGFQKYIYPVDPEFIRLVELELHKRGFEFPDYYLTQKAVHEEISHHCVPKDDSLSVLSIFTSRQVAARVVHCQDVPRILR